MSVVKHVKHTICIHPYWFYRRDGEGGEGRGREKREDGRKQINKEGK